MAKPTSDDMKRKAEELREQAKQLAAEARKLKRREQREAARRERERIQREAVALIEHTRLMTINVGGSSVSVYDYIVADYERAKAAAAAAEQVRRTQPREHEDTSDRIKINFIFETASLSYGRRFLVVRTVAFSGVFPYHNSV